jgi:hypothetical protein
MSVTLSRDGYDMFSSSQAQNPSSAVDIVLPNTSGTPTACCSTIEADVTVELGNLNIQFFDSSDNAMHAMYMIRMRRKGTSNFATYRASTGTTSAIEVTAYSANNTYGTMWLEVINQPNHSFSTVKLSYQSQTSSSDMTYSFGQLTVASSSETKSAIKFIRVSNSSGATRNDKVVQRVIKNKQGND